MKNTRHRKSSKRASTRKHRGGASYPPSAWGFQMGNLGDGWTQFTNALTLKAGDNVGSVQSNEIVPIKNLTAEDAQPMLKPNMSGGKRVKKCRGGSRKSMKTRRGGACKSVKKRRGGSRLLGAVAKQALVPFTLLASQMKYEKKHRKTA